jgi:hypothetical protein
MRVKHSVEEDALPSSKFMKLFEYTCMLSISIRNVLDAASSLALLSTFIDSVLARERRCMFLECDVSGRW